MTIPSTYKRNTVGGAFTEQKIGGVVIGVTSATDTTDGQPVTEVFDLKTQGTDGVSGGRRTTPKDTDITIEAKGDGVGTFAYDQSAFMIIGNQANNKINNSASTALTLNGHESARDNERSSLTPIGAKTSTAWRDGSFEYLGVSAQRTPWGSGTPDPMNAANYADGDTSSATTVDDAVGTQAVPGELAFMYGALIPNTGEYSARTGG